MFALVRMALRLPFPPTNNVVKSKHFSGQGEQITTTLLGVRRDGSQFKSYHVECVCKEF